MPTVLVTGSTGNVGRNVVAALTGRAGVTIRAATRTPEQAQPTWPDSVDLVRMDWDDPASIETAVAGCDAVFSLTPPMAGAVEAAARLAKAALGAGVRRLVRLSTAGTELNPGFSMAHAHRAIDEALMATTLSWTILQPNAFMTNFVSYFGPQPDGGMYLPWRDGRTSFIDERDIGEAAATVLTEDGHDRKVYVLTGPAAIDAAEVAAAIARLRPGVHYVDVPPAAVEQGMREAGLPDWLITGLLELHEVLSSSQVAEVTDAVDRLTGHPARSIDDFVDAHAAAWR